METRLEQFEVCYLDLRCQGAIIYLVIRPGRKEDFIVNLAIRRDAEEPFPLISAFKCFFCNGTTLGVFITATGG